MVRARPVGRCAAHLALPFGADLISVICTSGRCGAAPPYISVSALAVRATIVECKSLDVLTVGAKFARFEREFRDIGGGKFKHTVHMKLNKKTQTTRTVAAERIFRSDFSQATLLTCDWQATRGPSSLCLSDA